MLDSSLFHHAHLHGPRQLTDVYLLALAVENGGRLVGFDQRIPLSAVHGATAAHLVTL
jgi:predicted nucleic acid-binding protein